MVGWHHQLSGHEFEQTPGDNEGQRSLVCCSPQGRKEADMTERLNNNMRIQLLYGWSVLVYIVFSSGKEKRERCSDRAINGS